MSSESPVERSRRLHEAASWISTALLYAALITISLQRAGFIHIPSASLDGTVVLTATVASVFSAARRLPLQNALLAGAVIAAGGSLTALLAVRAQVWEFAPSGGPRLLGIMPWWIPLVWVITILASRGVAHWVLGGRQTSPRFGLEVMALTTGLSLVLQAGASRFVRGNGYGHAPSGGSLASLGICAVATAIILLVATPILINKKPNSPHPDCHPLIVWLPMAFLCLAGGFR